VTGGGGPADCAMATLTSDNIPIDTDKPARASRRNCAADSMAIRPLQKIIVKLLRAAFWGLTRIFGPPVSATLPTLYKRPELSANPILRYV
jgi:hypothetical protein